MIIIKLESEGHAKVLCNFIDLAIKSKGIKAAEAGVIFTRIIKKAILESKDITVKE